MCPIGVINAEGKLWKEQRRFLHEKLRRFGMTHLNSKNTKLQNLITVSWEKLIIIYSRKKIVRVIAKKVLKVTNK